MLVCVLDVLVLGYAACTRIDFDQTPPFVCDPPLSDAERAVTFADLLRASDKGGFIPANPSNLPKDDPIHDHDHLMRLLWLSTRYAFDPKSHYAPLVPGSEKQRAPAEVHELEIIAVKKEESLADCGLVLITPNYELKLHGANTPQWLCSRHYGDWCDSDDFESLYVSFRPMSIEANWKYPFVDDLINMRGRTDLFDCMIDGTSLEITEGNCRMLGSLISVKKIFDKIVDRMHSHKRQFIIFQGLSYGGALAQAAVVFFHRYLAKHHPHLEPRLALVLFGSPRVGGAKFAQAFIDTNIPCDHFIMHTYFGGYSRHTPTEEVKVESPQNLIVPSTSTYLVTPAKTSRKHKHRSGSSSSGGGAWSGTPFASPFGLMAPNALANPFLMPFLPIPWFQGHHAAARHVHNLEEAELRNTKLFYDPIAFWPAKLHNIGRLHSLIFYQDDHGHIVSSIQQDLFFDAAKLHNGLGVSVNSIAVREAPSFDSQSFLCLHWFGVYQAFFEKRASGDWCGPRPVPDNLVAEYGLPSSHEHTIEHNIQFHHQPQNVAPANVLPPSAPEYSDGPALSPQSDYATVIAAASALEKKSRKELVGIYQGSMGKSLLCRVEFVGTSQFSLDISGKIMTIKCENVDYEVQSDGEIKLPNVLNDGDCVKEQLAKNRCTFHSARFNAEDNTFVINVAVAMFNNEVVPLLLQNVAGLVA
eukprot:c9412_g1_i1.p1 GENE.c9412_g1_i1~~c9412_g1_i1.p1  ORF type:complete len:698 (+),score=160.20 c9412_g1_i1:1595-3688(+)